MTHAKPIIVITHGRSGSNLLLEYLDQCPGVIALNEIFRAAKPPGVDAISDRIDVSGTRLAKLAEMQKTDHVLFWRMLQRTLAAQDFRAAAKIFHGHVPREDRLWTAFRTAKVLHLVRENILAAIVSKTLARRSRRWKSESYREDYDAEPIVVSKRMCAKLLATLEADLRWAREKYRAADYSEIRYEDIATIETAQDILTKALETQVVLHEQKIVRQRRRPLNEVVANYAEVAKFDRGFALVRDTR
jgi:LPS sulfotransferase NodH